MLTHVNQKIESDRGLKEDQSTTILDISTRQVEEIAAVRILEDLRHSVSMADRDSDQHVPTFKGVFFGQELYDRLQKFDDYPIVMNSLIGGGMTLQEIDNVTKKNRTVVRRREYVTNLRKDSQTTKYNFSMNPASKVTFPLLSKMANRFRFFKYTGLVFEYQPRIEVKGNGEVSFQTATYGGKGQGKLKNQKDRHQGDFSELLIHPVKCYPAREHADYTIDEYSKKSRPFGNFMVELASELTVIGVVGQLWVSYEVQMWGDRPFRTKEEYNMYKVERALLKADVQMAYEERRDQIQQATTNNMLEHKAVDMLISYQGWLADVLNGMTEDQLNVEKQIATTNGYKDPLTYRMSLQLVLIRAHLGLGPRENG
jgi:hypothetical protein